MLVCGSRSPCGGLLEARTVDEYGISHNTQRDGVAASEKPGARQREATGIAGSANAIVEIAADPVTQTDVWKFNLDSADESPTPFIVGTPAKRRSRLSARPRSAGR